MFVAFVAVPAVAAFKLATWVVLAIVSGAVPVATVEVITPDADTVENEPEPLNTVAANVPVEGVYWSLVELVYSVVTVPLVAVENKG